MCIEYVIVSRHHIAYFEFAKFNGHTNKLNEKLKSVIYTDDEVIVFLAHLTSEIKVSIYLLAKYIILKIRLGQEDVDKKKFLSFRQSKLGIKYLLNLTKFRY